jgi:hypothetical protein
MIRRLFFFKQKIRIDNLSSFPVVTTKKLKAWSLAPADASPLVAFYEMGHTPQCLAFASFFFHEINFLFFV